MLTLRIGITQLSTILGHAAEAYPEECCGFLIGVEAASREVGEVRRATNVHPDHREVRYTIDPREQLRLEVELRGTGRELLGFYHSHPDHPGRPSSFDVERSWPVYSYVIVEVRGGRPILARSFRIDREKGKMREERVTVLPRERPGPRAGGKKRGKRRARRARNVVPARPHRR